MMIKIEQKNQVDMSLQAFFCMPVSATKTDACELISRAIPWRLLSSDRYLTMGLRNQPGKIK